MISTRKLIRMARKWHRIAAYQRKQINFPRHKANAAGTSTCSSSSYPVAEKGHAVVYTLDQRQYSFPITYLKNYVFRELFRMAEEEFGHPSDGAITIPCEAEFMEYLISLIQKGANADIEKALLVSFPACRFASINTDSSVQHPPVYCF